MSRQDWTLDSIDAAKAVPYSRADCVIVFRWTGASAGIVAHQVKGVRAALCDDAETLRGARK